MAGTVLEVDLNKPIRPGESTVFDMAFLGQAPLIIRRAGKQNKEGVALSMAQWYPKLAEYDHEGWHASPYIGREFHGVWGDFDVKLTIDKNFVVGGTGYFVLCGVCPAAHCLLHRLFLPLTQPASS